MKGLLQAQVAFIGIELYLFFRNHVDIKEKIKGFPLFVYQTVWFLFFFFSILITLLYFTISGLKLIPEPLLYLLKSQEFTFIERLDLFFLYIWMVWTVITVTSSPFAALYVHRLHANEHHKRDTIIWHVLLVLFPLFFLSKLTVEKMNSHHHLSYISYLALLFRLLSSLQIGGKRNEENRTYFHRLLFPIGRMLG